MAPCCICLTSNEPYRTALCSNRKGSFGHNLGNWTLCRLPGWTQIPPRNWSQALSVIAGYQESWGSPRQNTAIHNANDALHVHYQPWPAKDLCSADTLSRAPIVGPLNQEEEKLTDDVKAYVNSLIKHLPATEDRLEQLRSQQQQVAKQLIANYSDRWLEKSRLPSPLTAYWPERGDLTVQ